MPAYVDTVNTLAALGTIVFQIVSVVILIALLFARSKDNALLLFFKKYTVSFGFFLALGSMIVSLVYSVVIGFPACELCWALRVVLYPQVILLGLSLIKKDSSIVDYSLVLAIIGTLISTFHIYIEHGGASSLACATGDVTTISCATRYVYEFGYITIPVMGFSVGILLVLLLVNYKYIHGKR